MYLLKLLWKFVFRTPNQLQKSFRGSQSSLQSRQSSDTTQHLKDRPTSAYISNKDAYNLQNQVRFDCVMLSRILSNNHLLLTGNDNAFSIVERYVETRCKITRND